MVQSHPLNGTHLSGNDCRTSPVLKAQHIAYLRNIVTECTHAGVREMATNFMMFCTEERLWLTT
jgi:hypothetical protein